MAVAPERSERDSLGKTLGSAARRTGAWAHAALLGTEWTWLRILTWTAGVLIALIVAAVVWLYFLDWNTMRGPVARYASMRLGRPVRIDGDLDVHLFSLEPSVSVSGLKVANPDWAGSPQAADIQHLAFTFRLIPALFGDTILPLVQFDHPDIKVVRLADGRTNWDMGGGKTGWNVPPIRRFLVRDGHITVDDRVRGLKFVGTVSSEENAGARGSAFQLSGDGTLNGNKFTAQVHGGPLIHVDESKPYRFVADVRAGATHAVADGAIAHPFHLGQFSAAVTVSGPNLSDLYYLTGLVMPQTAPYTMKGTLTRDGTLYRFSGFTGTVGSSDLRGSFSVETEGARPMLRGAATSRVLDFKDLGSLFGGMSRTAVATGRLLPDIPLHVERLRQMDAEVDYDAVAIRSRDFPLRGVHTHVALRNAILTLKPLAFQFAYGRLSGTLQIDARKKLAVTTVDARITDVKVEQFLRNPPAATGVLEARARLQGFGNSTHLVAASASGPVTIVVPQGRFSEKIAELTGIDLLNGLMLGDRSETGLRCAVAHFDTRGGIMRAQDLVFDTDPVRIDGQGAIDLQHETLDLTVVGKPKEFRIGRLHAPITVTGGWAHPTIGIKPGGIIAQGGIAVALGLLFPPAAILPFVDPGLNKNANCSGLLTAAKAEGAPVRTRRH